MELEDGYTVAQVEAELKADDYFAHDELHVFAVKSVDDVRDMGHGVHLTRKARAARRPTSACPST